MTATSPLPAADSQKTAVSSAVSEHELNRLGEEFSARCRGGDAPSVDEFANRYTGNQRAEVRDFLESVALLEELRNDSTASSPSMIALPEQFGRYRIEKALGEGGMGTVYLAHDTQLDRKVALKTPKFGRHFDHHLVERFYREARSAATLQHPNICPVYDVGELNGIHYISMAYIEGRPLSDYIQATKLPSVQSTLRIIRRVALALHEAHQLGLVHRDLKPANIMIGRRNEPIVMDFGLARQFDGDDRSTPDSEPSASLSREIVESRLTLDGTVVGSPGYMAPEQLLGDQPRIGPASDVYALGVVMFELLTGRLPFPGTGNLMSIVSAVISDEVPDLTTLRPDVDAATSDVCRRAMARKIEDRFQTMEELAGAVTRLLKSGLDERGGPRQQQAAHESMDVVRKREQADLAKSLYEEGQYAAAVSILEKMTLDSESRSSELTEWAAAELPRYRAKAAADSGGQASSGFDNIWDNDLQLDAPAAAGTADPAHTPTRRTPRASRRRRRRKSTRLRNAGLVLLAVMLVVAAGKRWKNRAAATSDRPVVTLNSKNATSFLDGNSNPNDGSPSPDASSDTTADNASGQSSEQTSAAAQQTSETESSGGFVSGDAPTPSPNPVRRPPAGAMRAALSERLWRLDANDDNRLSRRELMVPSMKPFTVLRRVVDNFDRFDLPPRDGQLDPVEVQRMIRQMPRPGDGRNLPPRRREP